MSRGIRFVALAAAALLVVMPTGPAAAGPSEEVPDNGTITFTGQGEGHGRGMSQYGAYSAARAGVTYRQIAKTYYPRTRWRGRRGRSRLRCSETTTATWSCSTTSG